MSERLLSHFGAGVLGALLLAAALLIGTWMHDVHLSIGKATPSTTTPYVQMPTCFSHAQCPWFAAPPVELAAATIEFEAECETNLRDGRYAKPTHAELNWFANDSTTAQLCPNF